MTSETTVHGAETDEVIEQMFSNIRDGITEMREAGLTPTADMCFLLVASGPDGVALLKNRINDPLSTLASERAAEAFMETLYPPADIGGYL